MAPRNNNTTVPGSIATTDETDKFWDGSVLTRTSWTTQLPKTLPHDNPNHRTIAEEGWIVEKGIALTQSPSHSYHLSVNNVKRLTFMNPCPADGFTKIDATQR